MKGIAVGIIAVATVAIIAVAVFMGTGADYAKISTPVGEVEIANNPEPDNTSNVNIKNSGNSIVGDGNQIIIVEPQEERIKTHFVSIPRGTAQPGCENSDECYLPSTLNIKIGNTVNWDIDDLFGHTVTSGTAHQGPNGIFDSGLYDKGQLFSYTFDDAGTYQYFCMAHPWMVGKIVVEE